MVSSWRGKEEGTVREKGRATPILGEASGRLCDRLGGRGGWGERPVA